ncbi:hypothetical protein [Methylobacterium sp. CM6257]|jgi:hypothetical protein
MTRFTAAILAGLASLPLVSGACRAADPAAVGAAPGRWHYAPGGRIAGTVAPRGRPEYSYYGEYGYPAPFGYGYAYAPARSHGFDYGYYGPRYAWSAPDWYYGPAFGYYEW